MASKNGQEDPIPMYDNVDVDMVVKVLQQTAFSPWSDWPRNSSIDSHSGPFFTVSIPVFYFFHARGVLTPAVIISACYCAAVCAFCGWNIFQ